MLARNRPTILPRTSQCVAVAALMAGFAFVTTGIASAQFDEIYHRECLVANLPGAKTGEEINNLAAACCILAGGYIIRTDSNVEGCSATKPVVQSAPPTPTKPVGPGQGRQPGASLPPTPSPIAPVPLVPGDRG
jgi:hypothetical protein